MDWIENEFYIPETRHDPVLHGRIGLQEYQRDALREALTKDENGNFKYSIIVWSDIKKSAKSTIAASVVLARAEQTEWGEFYIVANDLKQADSRVNHYIRRAIQLNPKLKATYRTNGYRITAGSGAVIEAIPIDPSGEAGSNADQVVFCLDEQSEILTKDGWKGWETLTMQDEIATRSPAGVFEWQIPDEIYCAPYKGDMYKITSRGVDALVTPDHRMYGRFVGGRGIAPGVNGCESRVFVDTLENRFLKASDAAKTGGYFPVVTSEWPDCETAKEFIIPSTYARQGKGTGTKWVLRQPARNVRAELYSEFMGWYLAEGCMIRKHGSVDGFAIGQSSTRNSEKRERIIQMLKEMGFTPRLWSGGMNIAVYHSTFGKFLEQYGLSDGKYIPQDVKNLPRHCLEIFLKAYLAGDGCKQGIYGYTAGSRSRELRDDMVEVAQKCGYSVSTYERQDFRWKKQPILYYIYLRAKDGSKLTKVEKKNWSIVPYDGMVFCPSTPNGVIYVRRNGTYYWTGNSELWGANEAAKQHMWAELTIPPNKHGKAFRWIESYAGFAEEAELLYSLYELGVKQGEQLWPDKLYPVTGGEPAPLELFVNKEAGMLCLWNTMPRCPWQSPEYYASESKILPSNEFRRIHRNQWVSSTETFLPMEWFDACMRPDSEWPQIDNKATSHIVAMDAAVSGDCFALWMGCRHPERPDSVITRYSRIWKPKPGHPINFQGTDEEPGPEKELRRLIRDYNIVQVTYDPFQLHDLSTRLKTEGLAWFKAFPQDRLRLLADSQLRDLVRDRRFWHRGEADLRDHFQNANAEIDKEDHKIRIVKRTEKMKIDLCVASSMGSYNLLYLNL